MVQGPELGAVEGRVADREQALRMGVVPVERPGELPLGVLEGELVVLGAGWHTQSAVVAQPRPWRLLGTSSQHT